MDRVEYEVIVPGKDIDKMVEDSFSGLIMSNHLVEYASTHGCLFEIIGHDVYKMTDQGIPVNVYTTVTKKGFNGIVLGYSIASSNSEKTLKPLFTAFLVYLRQKFPQQYRQPMFMVDEEKGQINALRSLEIELTLSFSALLEETYTGKS